MKRKKTTLPQLPRMVGECPARTQDARRKRVPSALPLILSGRCDASSHTDATGLSTLKLPEVPSSSLRGATSRWSRRRLSARKPQALSTTNQLPTNSPQLPPISPRDAPMEKIMRGKATEGT